MNRLTQSLTMPARRGLQRCVEFALPWQCTICSSTTDRGNNSFCADCLTQLLPNGDECGRCGAIIGPFASGTGKCPHCRRRPFRFRSARCLNMYEDALKTAIVQSKLSFSSAAMTGIGQLLAHQQWAWLSELSVDRILPIPQTWLTRLARYYNPADEIAQCVGNRLGVTVDPHILRRRRSRQQPQKKVPLSQRYENQKNGFRLRDAHLVKGRRLLLVDDVLTTGATCSEAARLLKAAGARQVFVLVAARVADRW